MGHRRLITADRSEADSDLRALGLLAGDARPIRAQPPTAGFILIDESTNDTVAAGMVVDAR